jgi:Na+-driven multidrug efflux pump
VSALQKNDDFQAQQEAKFIRMTQQPVDKLIAKLAVPTICSMLITSIYNMADTYFVSQLDTSASAAVGVVFSLMAVIQAIGFTFGSGAQAIVSRRLGEKKRQQACETLSTAFFVALFVGI